VYADEQKLRPNSNKAQRFLLFKVLIHAMAYGTMLTEERILESAGSEALGNLTRVIDSYCKAATDQE